MDFLNAILGVLARLALAMSQLAGDLENMIWPLKYLGLPFRGLSNIYYALFSAFWDFSFWFASFVDRLSEVLSWDAIKQRLQGWFSQVSTLWSWFSGWWTNVREVVNTWWTGVSSTVRGWIDTATQGLTDLKVKWDDFWETTFPSLINTDKLKEWWSGRLSDVQSLIKGTITQYEDFWKGWSGIRDQVFAFFKDPAQWVYNRLDEFFERFW